MPSSGPHLEILSYDADHTYILISHCSISMRIWDLSLRENASSLRLRSKNLSFWLLAWLTLFDASVINRFFAERHISTKPLHKAILETLDCFAPASISKSDGATFRDYWAKDYVINKTLSDVQADCRLLPRAVLDDYAPTQGHAHLQERIEGFDVRVHSVGRVYFGAAARPDENCEHGLLPESVNISKSLALKWLTKEFLR